MLNRSPLRAYCLSLYQVHQQHGSHYQSDLANFHLSEVLKPAIEYASEGYPVSAEIGMFWNIRYHEFKEKFQGEEFDEWFKIFAPNDRAPEIGEIWHSPDHARTLQAIADTDGEAFYRGELAEKIAQCVGKYNGFLAEEDLACL